MKTKMITQSPAGRNRVSWLESGVAWAAARGVSTETHYGVILCGQYGTARFNPDGGGSVEWNEKSTTPGEVTRFGNRTTVCI